MLRVSTRMLNEQSEWRLRATLTHCGSSSSEAERRRNLLKKRTRSAARHANHEKTPFNASSVSHHVLMKGAGTAV